MPAEMDEASAERTAPATPPAGLLPGESPETVKQIQVNASISGLTEEFPEEQNNISFCQTQPRRNSYYQVVDMER